MNFLICVDIEKFNPYIINLTKYLYYYLQIVLKNHNIQACSLYFAINNKFYKKTNTEDIYYYLNKNTFDLNKYDKNPDLDQPYTNLILITNKLNYQRGDLILELIENVKQVIIFSFKTLRNQINKDKIIKFNEVSKSIIDYFSSKINLEENNFTSNFTIDFDKYVFEDLVNSPKVKQHYDYYLKQKKIKDLNGIEIDNFLLRNKKSKKIDWNKSLEIQTDIYLDLDDVIDDEEYFKSNVSLSDYRQEINDNSFMGIMISCDKSIYNLIFIPKMINTSFINEIISYNDFIEIYNNEIQNYNKINNENINIKKIEIRNINTQNFSVNSFIPIYINKIHFNSIKNNLQRYLSKIFTGLENHFDKRYYRIFYKILIDFVYDIYERTNNPDRILTDKDIILFLNYFRFCCEITKILGYHKGIHKYAENLSDDYKNTQFALEYLIAQIMCIGDINMIQKYINLNKNLYLKIIPQILNKIIIHFGSWTKFLNVFEVNNGYFEDISFMKNLKF